MCLRAVKIRLNYHATGPLPQVAHKCDAHIVRGLGTVESSMSIRTKCARGAGDVRQLPGNVVRQRQERRPLVELCLC